MRCPIHDLATASDGTCIRCRREGELATGRAPSSPSRALLLAGAFLAACGVLGVALWAARARRVPPPLPPPSSAAYAAPSSAPLAPLAALEPATVTSEAPPTPTASSTATPLTRAMHLATITFYSRPGSPECDRARAWLLAHGYTFTERAVDANDAVHAAWMKASPDGVVPAFEIDGQTLAGFAPGHVEGALEYAGARRLQR